MDVFYTDSSPQLKAYAKADVDKRISELEKQLAEARAEIERKDKLIEQMRETIKLALLFIPENATDAIRLSEAALSAAERMSK